MADGDPVVRICGKSLAVHEHERERSPDISRPAMKLGKQGRSFRIRMT
jgi:hypothetical protein